jgi:hypothetical protein
MAIKQSERGKIEVFMDFMGAELPLAGTASGADATAALCNFHPLVIRGEGIEIATSGIVPVADALSGVARFTTDSGTAGDSICLGTETCLSVGLMAPIIVEARVEMAALTNREIFIGLCGNFDDNQDEILTGSTGTLTLSAESDLCGFFFESGLSESVKWYMPFNGGTTTGETDASEVVSTVTPIEAEFDILRLEVDNNGTARWYINGNLEQTTEGAISTSTVMSAMIAVAYTATAVATLDVDYFYISANRDWTV